MIVQHTLQSRWALVLALFLHFPWGAWAGEGPRSIAQADDVSRTRRDVVSCGPNSLYLFLALNGVAVSYAAVESHMPSDPEGMSLLELLQASKALGLTATVRRWSMTDLRCGFERPVIAYLVKDPQYLVPTRHYVVVVDVLDEGIAMLDGTTGERVVLSFQRFEEIWSGYVLLREPRLLSRGIWFTSLVCGGVLLALLAMRLGRRPGRTLGASKTVLRITNLLAVAVSGTWLMAGAMSRLIGQEPPVGTVIDRVEYYRAQENDATNCLYLQLRLLGYQDSYLEYRGKLGKFPGHSEFLSLKALKEIARGLGFSLSTLKMTPPELLGIRKPLILHLEESGIGCGRFLLFLGAEASAKKVALIEGAYVTPVEMPVDELRRKWTGYVLFPGPAQTPVGVRLGRTAAILVIAFVGWLARRAHLRSRSHVAVRPSCIMPAWLERPRSFVRRTLSCRFLRQIFGKVCF